MGRGLERVPGRSGRPDAAVHARAGGRRHHRRRRAGRGGRRPRARHRGGDLGRAEPAARGVPRWRGLVTRVGRRRPRRGDGARRPGLGADDDHRPLPGGHRDRAGHERAAGSGARGRRRHHRVGRRSRRPRQRRRQPDPDPARRSQDRQRGRRRHRDVAGGRALRGHRHPPARGGGAQRSRTGRGGGPQRRAAAHGARRGACEPGRAAGPALRVGRGVDDLRRDGHRGDRRDRRRRSGAPAAPTTACSGRRRQPVTRRISRWRRLLVCGRTCAGQRPCSTALAQASVSRTSGLSSS